MGTDIHLFAERRVGEGWHACLSPEPDQEGRPGLQSVYENDRNYELFRILADIPRLTNAGFDPICGPKGLPPDLSPEVRAIADSDAECGMFCHGHSWLTLKELLEFPWHEKKRRFCGYVDGPEYARFKQTGRPDRLACSAGAPISNEEMDQVIQGHRPAEGAQTLIEIEIPYAEFCGQLLSHTIPLLQSIGEPNEVRIVFWFDS